METLGAIIGVVIAVIGFFLLAKNSKKIRSMHEDE
jgi:hypothetical protein